MHRFVSFALFTTALVGFSPTAQAADAGSWTSPIPPPRCTVAEANSGDVGHCLLSFYHDPATTGWGAPPAPGVGDGWSYTGSGYNGSPALAAWEAAQIGANAGAVAGLAPGRVETHVAVQALFEGFLQEISDRGYRVRDASGYSFRCTTGTGGWSCPSGDPNDLSNHAWGLAVDMNSGTNPIRSYTGVDGGTACAVPIVTDFPQWAIQTAERWGLYWGGYGWNSGCRDTTSERSSVYRDPPHFEFRGTVEQAAAIAAFNVGNDPSAICFDVVDDNGNDIERCNRTGRPEAGWRLPVQVDPPAGATAVMFNLTVTEPTTQGFLTLETCGPVSADRATSALTFAPDDSVATMAVTPLDDDGRFCVYRSTAVHSIVDVVGFLGADGEPMWFHPSTPTRLTDTRAGGACAPSGACHSGPVGSQALHAVPTTDSRPRLANVAVIEGAGPGFLQAGTCDGVGPQREFSNLNYQGDSVRSNLALIDNDISGSCVYALTQTHVIVDELGTLDDVTGYGWSLQQPDRVLDTRDCTPQWCANRPIAGTVLELDLHTDAPAAAIAITATATAAGGFVSAGPCELFEGGAIPETSNLNHMAGQTVTNLALVELDAGRVCLFTLAAAHVIVDVQAELTVQHVIGLSPVEPTRAHDSRSH
ncbi:MAG: M15 family metallopeptidase [Ilumatobacter sp.]